MSQLYQGRRKPDGSCEILADGKPLSLRRSLRIWNHSPTGFEWGYGGSGPAQSALAILLDYTGKRNFCERFHQDFKWQFMAPAPKKGWVITSRHIDEFITRTKAEEAALQRPLCEECWCEEGLHSETGRQKARCWNKGCKCGTKVPAPR